MKILCIDTSSNLCNVAVLNDTVLLEKVELDNGLTHSETLIPIIDNTLKKCSLSIRNIDLLVVNIGPGSFTGIRISIATVKAFCDSLNIPCIGINSLELLAYNIKAEGLICSTIDCKNNNCYFALYNLYNNCYTVLEQPCSMSCENVLDLLNTKYKDKKISFIGNGIPSKSTNCYLNVENLGILGFEKFSNNNLGETILPLYLKKPQAQIELEKKNNNL